MSLFTVVTVTWKCQIWLLGYGWPAEWGSPPPPNATDISIYFSWSPPLAFIMNACWETLLAILSLPFSLSLFCLYAELNVITNLPAIAHDKTRCLIQRSLQFAQNAQYLSWLLCYNLYNVSNTKSYIHFLYFQLRRPSESNGLLQDINWFFFFFKQIQFQAPHTVNKYEFNLKLSVKQKKESRR